VKVAHLDSPMMGQQKCECSVVDLKSSWRREQGVWALSSGRFTRRDDLGFDQCLSIQDGRSLVLLVAILGLPLVLEHKSRVQQSGPIITRHRPAEQGVIFGVALSTDHCNHTPHRQKVMPTLRMLVQMLHCFSNI
jgi:hypothetical protein